MNSKTHSPFCATNGLNIGARNRVIVLAQRQNLGFRPFLSFAFISLTINSVMASETPVPPNCRAETTAPLRRASPTKASLLNARHQRANEKARGCRANLRFRREQNRS